MADNKLPSDVEFLKFVIKALVEYPEKVEVERKVDEMGVLLVLKVDPADMGKVIGKSGSMAQVLRSLLRAIGLRHNARVNLKIEEPEGQATTWKPRQTQVRSMTSEDNDSGSPSESSDMSDADKVMEDLENI